MKFLCIPKAVSHTLQMYPRSGATNSANTWPFGHFGWFASLLEGGGGGGCRSMAFGGVFGTATVAGCLASAFGGVLGPGAPALTPAALVASAPAFALAYVSLRNLSDCSENSGTPKSSILIGVSIINHPFWAGPLFLETPICQLSHLVGEC